MKRAREYAKRVKMELAARMRQEASVVEVDALRRQAEALRQALDYIVGEAGAGLAVASDEPLTGTGEELQNSLRLVRDKARAASARYGGGGEEVEK